MKKKGLDRFGGVWFRGAGSAGGRIGRLVRWWVSNLAAERSILLYVSVKRHVRFRMMCSIFGRPDCV